MFWQSNADSDDIELAAFKAAIMIYLIDEDEKRAATIAEIDSCVNFCIAERKKKFNDRATSAVKTTAIILSIEKELMGEMYQCMMARRSFSHEHRSRCLQIVEKKVQGFLG